MSTVKRKIALFGVTGNLGKCVLDAALADDRTKDWEIVAITRQAIGLPANVKTRVADYADVDSLACVLRDIDAVAYALPLHESMMEWNANLVKAAGICEVAHLLRFSEPLADPSSRYLPLRIQGEMDELALERGNGTSAVIRPNFFMQNFAVYFRHMVRAGKLVSAQGQGRISYVDLRDVGAVALEMLLAPEGYHRNCISLTGGAAYNNAEVAEVFSYMLERPCAYQAIRHEAYADALRARGMNAFQIQFLSELEQLVHDNAFSYIDGSLSAILNRRPIPLSQFILDHEVVWQ